MTNKVLIDCLILGGMIFMVLFSIVWSPENTGISITAADTIFFLGLALIFSHKLRNDWQLSHRPQQFREI